MIALTVPEAQYLLRGRCMEEGRLTLIDKGEFEQSSVYRLQLPPNRATVTITEPTNLFDLPKEITIKQIAEYMVGLMDPTKGGEATYTYGNRMATQLPIVMEMLRKTPHTNQAIIEIGLPTDFYLDHMPCLRSIHFIVWDGKLDACIHMRSNDLEEAFLLNNYGFAFLHREVAEYAEIPLGHYHYTGTGTHIYSHSLEQLKSGRHI